MCQNNVLPDARLVPQDTEYAVISWLFGGKATAPQYHGQLDAPLPSGKNVSGCPLHRGAVILTIPQKGMKYM